VCASTQQLLSYLLVVNKICHLISPSLPPSSLSLSSLILSLSVWSRAHARFWRALAAHFHQALPSTHIRSNLSLRSEHVRGWGNGGLCSNYGAILSYTNWHNHNHVWARYGVFHWNPHHQYTGWHCRWWWWSCWSYHYQHCHIYSGSSTTAIYACHV
jgi:hypothetical protein